MCCCAQMTKLLNSCNCWGPTLSSQVKPQVVSREHGQQTCLQVYINNAGDVQIGFINGCLLHNSIRCNLMENCNDFSRGNSVALQAGLLGLAVFPCHCTVISSAGIATCMAYATMMPMSLIPLFIAGSEGQYYALGDSNIEIRRLVNQSVCNF